MSAAVLRLTELQARVVARALVEAEAAWTGEDDARESLAVLQIVDLKLTRARVKAGHVGLGAVLVRKGNR